MDTLLSLLAFVGLCYLMMRFGCGDHMGHNPRRRSHSGDHRGESPTSTAIDPVCGMTVPPESGWTRARGGGSYRFCSAACLEKFDAQPDAYVPKAAA